MILLIGWLFPIFAAFCCGFAWLKGGPPERAGGLAIFGAWAFVSVAQIATHDLTPILLIMVADFALATTFLVLALRYSSLWLGAALLFQGVELAVHAAFMGDATGRSQAHIYWLEAMSLLILVSILGGTLAAWSRRSKTRSCAVQPAVKHPAAG